MLTKEVLKRVREIQVRTGRQVADVLAGQYVSVFKGRGMEFDEVRPYVPGDEVRTIDWNVTARMGQPFVKRYVEERQLTLLLMADISASMDFGSGSRSKREAAAELCALLAFSATSNDDKVGLTLFHGEIEHIIPPRKGQKHALRVVREVLAHDARLTDYSQRQSSTLLSKLWKKAHVGARRQTNIAAAINFLMSTNKRRAVCFIVSDFFDEAYISAMQTASRKHDVIAVLVTDPRELEFHAAGLVNFLDAETGRLVTRDMQSSALHRAFASHSQSRVEELRRSFRKARIDFLHVDASSSVVDPLASFFRMRERRSRR